MDGSFAIETTRTALLRIVSGLVAMAGWAGAALASPLEGRGVVAEGHEKPQNGLFERPSARSESKGPGEARRGQAEPFAEPGEGVVSRPTTLPRHLRLAILQILRPAESATRRLAIAVCRTLPPLPPVRLRKLPPKPKQDYFEIPPKLAVRPGQHKTGVIVPFDALKRFGPDGTIQAYLIPKPMPAPPLPARRRRDPKRRPRLAAFPLLDPLANPMRVRRKVAPRHNQPRVWSFDTPRPPTPRPPAPGDPVDATALARRISVLADALNDLPRQARRYQRWEMLRAARKRREALTGVRGRPMRLSPLKPGRPPGGRLSRWEPERVYRSKAIREIDEILARAHDLALYALERPDTS